MKTKRAIAYMMIWFGMAGIHAQENTLYLSLPKACQLAIEQNVNVQNAGLEKQKMHFQLRETQSRLYPQFEGYSTFNYYFAIPKMIVPGEIFGQTGLIPIEIGTTYDWSNGFKATQILYNQSYFTSLKLAQQMENLSALSLLQQQEEIVYQVSQVYFLCQNTLKQIEFLSKTLANTDRLLEISKLQSENGIIRSVDHARVQVNKSNIETQVDDLKRLHHQQLGLLKYLIGLELSQEIILADSLEAKPAGIITGPMNFSNRSEMQILDKQLEITRLSRRSSQHAYLPILTGFGQYYLQGQRNEFDFFEGGEDKFYKVGVIGLSLTVPLFDGFEKRNKIRQYDIELQQLINTRENTAVYFSKEYGDAVRRYNNSHTAVLRQQKNCEVAEQTYTISLQGYEQQIVSLSDLLLSESSFTETQLSYYNALMELKNAELELKKAKGELLKF